MNRSPWRLFCFGYLTSLKKHIKPSDCERLVKVKNSLKIIFLKFVFIVTMMFKKKITRKIKSFLRNKRGKRKYRIEGGGKKKKWSWIKGKRWWREIMLGRLWKKTKERGGVGGGIDLGTFTHTNAHTRFSNILRYLVSEEKHLLRSNRQPFFFVSGDT